MAAAGQLQDDAAERWSRTARRRRTSGCICWRRRGARFRVDRHRTRWPSVSSRRWTRSSALERIHGHFLNWYDTRTLATAAARATSRPWTAATCAATCIAARAGACDEACSATCRRRDPANVACAARAAPIAHRARSSDAMDFAVALRPRAAALFHIGYNVDARAARQELTMICSRRRRGWRASRDREGRVPAQHWVATRPAVLRVASARRAASRGGGTMFEYLMPSLVMRDARGQPARPHVPARRRPPDRVRRGAGVPWGISESAYSLTRPRADLPVPAFGVPGLGLKRGLGDDLVVAPYATALAAHVDAARGRAQLRAPAALRGEGELRLLRGDRLHAGAAAAGTSRAVVARTWPTTRA